MTVTLERDGDSILLFAPRTSDGLAKQIPGGRHDRKAGAWRYPLSWAVCVIARGVFGKELSVGVQLNAWARNELEVRVTPATNILTTGEEEPGLDELFPFQRLGVRFLRTAGSALLCDEMGLGKTVQAIQTLELDRLYPALVVTPNSVKDTWLREYAKWAPQTRVIAARNGSKAATEDAERMIAGEADVLVVNWEALKGLSRLAPYGSIRLESCERCDPTSTRKPHACQREDKVLNFVQWAAVVADEVHRAVDPKSQQTRALWALGDRADRRIGLSGTPIPNTAEDLWPVMRFVAPDEWPAKWPWVERYAVTSPNFYSGGVDIIGLREDRREELDRFFAPRFLRRLKKDVWRDLPEKIRERRDVVMSPKQKRAYDQMEKEMTAAVDGGIITADNVLTASLRLRQLASAYGEVTSTENWKVDEYGERIKNIEKQVILTEPSSKLDVLEEVLDELGDRQAVIFAESAQLIELAYARLLGNEKYDGSVGMIIGDVPQGERPEVIQDFIDGKLKYLLLTLGVGSTGIDGLQVADTAIYLQRPWSAVLDKQSEDRLHRLGQKSQKITYIDLVTKDTVEDKVFDALRRKADAQREVVGDDEPD